MTGTVAQFTVLGKLGDVVMLVLILINDAFESSFSRVASVHFYLRSEAVSFNMDAQHCFG